MNNGEAACLRPYILTKYAGTLAQRLDSHGPQHRGFIRKGERPSSLVRNADKSTVLRPM